MSRVKISLSRASSSAGFTLVEIAAIVAISSLLMVTGIGLINTWMTQQMLATNQQRMTAIQQALKNYVAQNNRLPCPASFIAKTSATYFGREVSAGCAGGLNPNGGDTYSATGRANPGGTSVIIGAVPVRDLGLPDSYRTNPYGYQYSYAVTESETSTVNPLNAFNGAIDVVDKTGATILTSAGTAMWVVVDHGKDGKGAFTANSTATAVGTSSPAISCTSSAGLDQLNCKYSGEALIKFITAPFSTTPGANWFDDTVVYNSMPSTTGQTCTTAYANSYKPSVMPVTGIGTSSGYVMGGYDSGGGAGLYICLLFICGGAGIYEDSLTFGPSPVSGFSAGVGNSPTADAYCPDTTYNVVAGGCSQTYGTPENSSGAPIVESTGSNGKVNGTYNGPIADHGASNRGIYTGDLGPGSNEQIVMPPQGHPIFPTVVQGWECNGSSASGMQTQAYAICCTGAQ